MSSSKEVHVVVVGSEPPRAPQFWATHRAGLRRGHVIAGTYISRDDGTSGKGFRAIRPQNFGAGVAVSVSGERWKEKEPGEAGAKNGTTNPETCAHRYFEARAQVVVAVIYFPGLPHRVCDVMVVVQTCVYTRREGQDLLVMCV